MRSICGKAISLFLVAILVSACGGATPASAPVGSAPVGSAPVGSASIGTTAPASSGAPSSQPVAGGSGLPVLGSATFTADAARKRTAEVSAGAGPVTLAVGDDSGATWTLTIPDGAFVGPAMISITPLSGIVSGNLPGPILGGILLEPEGTQFLVPASLTVTGSPAKGAALILSGDSQGDVRLEPPAGGSWSTVEVSHFSARYAVDSTDPSWNTVIRNLERDALSAESEAAILLNQPDLDVPEAPSIPTECRDGAAGSAADQQVAEFKNRLLNPEADLIGRFLAVWRADEVSGNGRDLDPMATQLIDRLVRKAAELLRNTPPQPDKVLPVLSGILAIAREAEILGTDTQALLGLVGPWVARAIDATVVKIASEHDYRQYLVVWWLAKTASILGSDPDLEALQAKLERALRFDAEITWTVTNPDGEHWRTVGTIPLRYQSPMSKDTPFVSGEASVGDISYGGHPQGLTLVVSPFTAKARLTAVDVCAATAKFEVDRFFSDDERYRDPQGGGLTLSRSWVNWEFVIDPDQGDGYYIFPVKLNNGSATWADETIDDAVEGWTSSLKITVSHTP